MNDSRYPELGLYAHNADSYTKVKSILDAGSKVVGIVHATGTGKSFNALQLALDNRDKKIVYVVPSKGIIEHLREIINSNPNLDFDRDFPNLEFRTYQSFIPLEEDEIRDMDCDLLILDEFHHIGAPVWGARINTMIETHPDIQVFGMTAYTVRDRGTPYERDMADPDTDELFSGKIASRYDLCDAMIEGVLPKPVYRAAYINLMETAKKLEERVLKLNPESKDYKELMSYLSDVKKRIHEAPGIPEVLKMQLKPNGKYIYFCPPVSEEGTNDIETIKKQALEWFKQIYPGKEIVIYTTTSQMGVEGKKNRDAFYSDKTLDGEDASDKLRIMFAINQYNEGIHAPNIDGVILGRGTCSDIVFFEQLGRALSVRGNTKEKFEELEKYSIEELIRMCNEKGIPIKDNMEKEDLIEKLIAPIVIDLTNNIDFIRDLENRLRDRIKIYSETGEGISRMAIKDASFDIEMYYFELFEMLRYVMDRLIMEWDDYFELAKSYYEKNRNLFVPLNFKTINGYESDENGVNLYSWVCCQRRAYKGKGRYAILSQERIGALENIGMIWDKWGRGYELAKAYYEKHKNLLVPREFKTKNGSAPCNERGAFSLGDWIHRNRVRYSKGKLSEKQIKLLEDIRMVWDVHEAKWFTGYELAKEYYDEHKDLLISEDYITPDGYNLGRWIGTQRGLYLQKDKRRKGLSEKQIKLLEDIGMVWDVHEAKWFTNYKLAKAYYDEYKNLLVPKRFKTKNGIDRCDEKGAFGLGYWIESQREKKKQGELSDDQIKLLEDIGMVWDISKKKK